jgi:cytosine/creatinine deaminase
MRQVIREVRLRGREGSWDVVLDDERIAAVEQRYDGAAEKEHDGHGGLLVPGFVNAHMHLDKCMLAPVMRQNASQTLQEAIEITWDHKRHYTAGEIADRAGAVIEQAILNGTTHMRGFADVDTIGGLVPVQGLLELKRRFEGRIRLEVCAFPQEAVIRDPGCDKLMEQAMDLGADVVGGLPWYEYDDAAMREQVDFCFELAKRHDSDIHVLADDTDDAFSRSLEYVALRTMQEGYGGRVAASHCGALAAYDHAHAEKVIGMVRDAGVTICSNAHISLVMDGHGDRGLVRRGITRVRELVDAGVNVMSAQDDVHDPYYPFGRCDQLEVGQYMAHVAHMTYPSDIEKVFDMITVNGARAMRLEAYGTEPGDRADLVVIAADDAVDALRRIPPRTLVFYGGRLQAESRLESTLHA